MTTNGEGAIGALDYDQETREIYAKRSRTWVCTQCKSNNATCLQDESEAPVQKLECDPELSFMVKESTDTTAAGSPKVPPVTCSPKLPPIQSELDAAPITIDTLSKETVLVSSEEVSHSTLVVAPTSSPASINEPARQRRPPVTRTIPTIAPRREVQQHYPRLLFLVLCLIALIIARRAYLYYFKK